MSYTKTTWRNNQAPAINADNLNHMEQGIESAHNQIGVNTSNIESLTTQVQNNATNIASEISARQTTDSSLQSQIDQLVAPTGEAPTPAEIENARIGDDGVTYDTLGNAIRGQFSDVKSELNKYGAINLANLLEGTFHPNTLTIVFAKNTADISGTATGSEVVHVNLYRDSSEFPTGLGAGQTVQFAQECSNNNVHFRFYEFINGVETLVVDISGTGVVQHTISENASGCTVRFSMEANGQTYDHVKSTYYIFTELTKQQIADSMEEVEELSLMPNKISSFATFEENEFLPLLSLGLTNNCYWGNNGLNSISADSNGYYRAANTLVSVNAGDHLILKDFYLYGHAGSALLGMYDNDGNNAPGRVNCNSEYVKAITVENNTIKYVDVEIPEGCTQVGLFIKTPNGVTECISSYRISNYDYTFEFTEIAEDKIKGIAIEAVSEMSIEAQDIDSDYYIKGEAPKLQRIKKLCIIGAGQSNIDGRVPASELPNYISLPMSGMYYEKNDLTGQFTNYYPTVTNWSFDLIMSYHLIQNLGANNFYYIKWSLGGTSIDASGDGSSHWTPDYENLESDNALILQFNKEIQKCIEQNPDDFQIGAMIWHQGEGDRGSYSATAANNYYTNLKKVIAFCRGIAQNECLPFILGTVSHNSAQYDATVDTAIRTIAQEDPYVYLVDMQNAVLQDSYHFNAPWSIYFGEKVYDALIDAKVITGTKINPSEPT